MKLDRRTFVKGMAFAGGSALGLTLSPTPWYLVRDLAFWTQNWPWVPVPAPGEPSFEKSVCHVCGGGCGLMIRRIDDRLVRIDGDRNHPVNKGALCPLGAAAIQMVYGPARIKTPLRRMGTRENPRWEPISWPAAIEEATARIRDLRTEQKSHTLACITSATGSTVNQLFERFLHAVGSRNFMTMGSPTDAQNITLSLMQGGDGNIAYDMENTRCILSFGADLFDGWGTCGRMFQLHARRFAEDSSERVEVVQIEPNLSISAAKSSEWVPIKPGTDAALALSIAYVLIDEGLYDKNFVSNHCFGFEDWKSSDGRRHEGFKSTVLARYSPPSVELITGISEEDIRRLARQFAAGRPSIAIGGRGTGNLFANLYELMAIHSLNALVGNINGAGGVLEQPPVPVKALPSVKLDAEAARGYAADRLDEAGSANYPFARSLAGNLNTDKVGMLLIHEANPAYALPDRKTAKDIFEKIPYIISLSSFMDESTSMADLVLPLATSLERWDDQIGAPGFPYPVYNFNRPLIEPLYEGGNAGDILITIAHGLGGTIAESFPWNNMVEVLRERAQGLYDSHRGVVQTPVIPTAIEEVAERKASPTTDYTTFSQFWSALVQSACWYDPAPPKSGSRKTLATPSGKFEFYSQRMQEAFGFAEDLNCMPHYVEQMPNPEDFDLLIMPVNLIVMADNGGGTPPLLLKQLGNDVLVANDLFVQINPITAMYQGLKDGDTVVLETPTGKVKVRVRIFAGVHEGVVLLPLGFGHTAYDQFLANKGVNAHQVIEAGKDAVSGLPTWWATPGRIYKV